jgi:hypothetical protein
MTSALARRLLAALVLLPLSGCGGDATDDYCAAVEEHQAELTEIVAAGGPTALLRALEQFRDLQDRAPSDIADEWQQVVGRLSDLDDELVAAGIAPETYDRDAPPEGLDAGERARIEAAAKALVSPETAGALEGLQQQARDVCQTPLTR